MDLSVFTEQKTGTFVPIQVPGGADLAFIPAKLPPGWEFPRELFGKLIEARTALAKLDGIGHTLPDPELLLSPLKRREAIASSRIEGTYATAQELMLFELSQAEPKSAQDPANAWKEVHNYAQALATGNARLAEWPFSGRLFKEMHQILMSGVRGQHTVAGEYRAHQVAIGSNRRFVPPPVAEMQMAIDALEKYINEDDPAYDPLVRAYLVHYQFEAIHPFSDGNGRIGRVILALMIGKWCQLTRPWLYMSAFFERYKDEYVANLFAISAAGAWGKWIDFCLTGTIRQANDAILRCEKLGALKKEMLERAGVAGGPRALPLIDSLFRTPYLQLSTIQKQFGVSYPTAQADADRLVDLKVLEYVKDTRPKTYYAPQIFAAAYGEPE